MERLRQTIEFMDILYKRKQKEKETKSESWSCSKVVLVRLESPVRRVLSPSFVHLESQSPCLEASMTLPDTNLSQKKG